MRRFRNMMARSASLFATLACALIALPARAQVVFEDNFDGSALGAHWITPPASNWVHDVSGGMLNVHRVALPIPHPKGTQSIATGISTTLASPHPGDFLATMRFVWQPDTVPVVSFSVQGMPGLIARMMYTGNLVTIGSGAASPPALPGLGAGVHLLGIERNGALLRFTLNGSEVGTLPDNFMQPIRRIDLGFENAFPIPSGGPVRVDYVRVVPTPGLLVWCLLFAPVRKRG